MSLTLWQRRPLYGLNVMGHLKDINKKLKDWGFCRWGYGKTTVKTFIEINDRRPSEGTPRLRVDIISSCCTYFVLPLQLGKFVIQFMVETRYEIWKFFSTQITSIQFVVESSQKKWIFGRIWWMFYRSCYQYTESS